MSQDQALKIFKQIEYYFSDINFSKDNFLKDLSGKEDGWIPITTLLTFNRLKSLTTNVSDVVDAFENNKSESIELNETKDKLRRLKPLPEIDDDFKQNCKLRTVHLKGFPREETTLDDLIEYCAQYGEIESVQMRRFKDDKKFKGCCFAVYKDIESANKAVSSNDKFKGEHSLTLRENKETYFNRKFNSKPKKENKPVGESKADDENQNDESKSEKKSEEEDKNEFKYETDTIIKIYDLPSTITFKDIKPKLSELASIQYVDIFPETQSAIIRFKSKTDRDIVLKTLAHECNEKNGDNSESKVVEEKNESDKVESNNVEEKEVKSENVEVKEENTEKKETVEVQTNETSIDNANNETNSKLNDNKMMLKIKDDLIVKYSLVEGDEEKEYWDKIKKVMQESNKRQKQYKKSRFGTFNKFNRKRSANGDRNNNKKSKVDA